MNTEQQIDFLNTTVRMRLAPSTLHGVGVFAMKDIPKGTKLFADRAPTPYKISAGSINKLFPDVRAHLIERWPQIVNGGGFVYPDVHLQGYMNHSDTPNYDAHLDLTLKDIATGEEILEDYRQISGWEQAFSWLAKKGVV